MNRKAPAKMDELCRMLSVATGMRVDGAQRESIRRAVARRMAALDVHSGAEYTEILDNPEALRAEVEAVIPDVMASDTAFFRTREHFDLLKERIIPEILQRVGSDRPVRIWDAGCATGEGTYSTAILLDMYFRRFAEGAYLIGTDINSNAIATAMSGRYGANSVAGLDDRESAYFSRSGGGYEVKPRIRNRVHFGRHNLIEDLPTWKRAGIRDMDVIVCCDVLLYFQPEIAQRVIIQFYECMAPGGYLVLAQAEGILTVHSPFDHCVYRDMVYCRKQLLGHGRIIPFAAAQQ